ncbi:MAG: hypothetical protein JWL97_2806, partial [Gemmatimonadales bacterium]|nr:hypothetical protein [Gemmatimonadales bacterium]
KLLTTGHPALGHAIQVFAADWRHGLNGHSPLFMPGFFVLTPATWYWSRQQSIVELIRGGALALFAGFLLALFAAPLGKAAAARAFFDEFHFAVQPDSRATWQAAPICAFTAICWTVLVVAIRRAITTGSSRPLALVVSLYALLGFARQWWSVDHFRNGNDVARWETRAAQGDAVAIGSLVAVPLLGLLLAKTTVRQPRLTENCARVRRDSKSALLIVR